MSNWNWMVGRKFSLGRVYEVFDDTATVDLGDGEIRLISEVLEDDYKEQDRFDRELNEALNTGEGSYRP